jgi:kynurenine formamidase
MNKSIFSISIALISIIAISGCSGRRAAKDLPKELFAQSNSIDESKVIDLTYNFDETTIYWPTAKSFLWEKEFWGMTNGRYWYTAARYSASEHGGTHLDSPIHFGQGQSSLDQIPLARLIGPGAVIDIAKACEKDPDYRLTVEDISAWENTNGRIPDESIVLTRTGWGKFWTDKKKYLGTDKPGDVANLHFPGISREAAEFLAKQRKIDGIGIDTASLDHGPSQDFIAHQILNGANIYGLENIAKLDQLPARGATLIALPMKIKGGTGGPVRIIAILP